jgi:hypothetical protein
MLVRNILVVEDNLEAAIAMMFTIYGQLPPTVRRQPG